MDPSRNLQEIRALAELILTEYDNCSESVKVTKSLDSDDMARLAELIQALDQWVSRGGFLPRQWRNEP